MLRDPKEGENREGSSMRGEKTTEPTVGQEGDKDPSSPVEIKMLDGKGHMGLEESLEDDMIFFIRRLFFEDDASKGITNLPL